MPYGETDYPKTKRARERLFDRIIDAGRAGKSQPQIAEMIGVSCERLQIWQGKHAELARIMTLANDYALAWWEALGKRQAETREGNSSVFIFVMKNRFEKDYGKDANDFPPTSADEHALAELSPKTRAKLRKLLQAEAELTANG